MDSSSGFPYAAIREILDVTSKRHRDDSVNEVLSLFNEWKGINSNMDNVVKSALGLASFVDENNQPGDASVPPLPTPLQSKAPTPLIVSNSPEITPALPAPPLPSASANSELVLSRAIMLLTESSDSRVTQSFFSGWRLVARESFISRKFHNEKSSLHLMHAKRIDKLSESMGALAAAKYLSFQFSAWRRLTADEKLKKLMEISSDAESEKSWRLASALFASRQAATVVAAFTGWRREAYEGFSERVAQEHHSALITMKSKLEEQKETDFSVARKAVEILQARSASTQILDVFRAWRFQSKTKKLEKTVVQEKEKVQTVDFQYRKILYFKMCFNADERIMRSAFRDWQDFVMDKFVSSMEKEIQQLKESVSQPTDTSAVEKAEEASSSFALAFMHSRRILSFFSGWRAEAFKAKKMKKPKLLIETCLPLTSIELQQSLTISTEIVNPPQAGSVLSIAPNATLMQRKVEHPRSPQPTWMPSGVGVPPSFEMPLGDALQILADGMWILKPKLWGFFPCLPPQRRFLSIKTVADMRNFFTVFTDSTCSTLKVNYPESAVAKAQFNFILLRMSLLDEEKQEDTFFGFTVEFMTALAVVIADIEAKKTSRRASTMNIA